MSYLRLCVRHAVRGEGLLLWQILFVHLTKTRMLLHVSSAALPDAAYDCLLSEASNDTFQIFNTWGNFLFSASVFKQQTVYPKEKKKDPSSKILFLFFFHQPWKYLSWIPLVSCNSPSSCFTVSCCQQCVWFMSQVLVGQGLPHGTPGPGRGGVPVGQPPPLAPPPALEMLGGE